MLRRWLRRKGQHCRSEYFLPPQTAPVPADTPLNVHPKGLFPHSRSRRPPAAVSRPLPETRRNSGLPSLRNERESYPPADLPTHTCARSRHSTLRPLCDAHCESAGEFRQDPGFPAPETTARSPDDPTPDSTHDLDLARAVELRGPAPADCRGSPKNPGRSPSSAPPLAAPPAYPPDQPSRPPSGSPWPPYIRAIAP